MDLFFRQQYSTEENYNSKEPTSYLPKWQKNDLVSWGHGPAWPNWELAWTMNWVDRLRTSADKRMWSWRRAVVMRTGRRAELLGVKLGCPRSRCRAVVSDVLCVRSYVHFVCVCVYMCMCVCVRTWYMYIYACVYVFVHLCVYIHVYVYVYAYLCIDCRSWYQCFSVWTVSCMRICFRVHMHAYVCTLFFCSECYMLFTGIAGTSA